MHARSARREQIWAADSRSDWEEAIKNLGSFPGVGIRCVRCDYFEQGQWKSTVAFFFFLHLLLLLLHGARLLFPALLLAPSICIRARGSFPIIGVCVTFHWRASQGIVAIRPTKACAHARGIRSTGCCFAHLGISRGTGVITTHAPNLAFATWECFYLLFLIFPSLASRSVACAWKFFWSS